MTSPFGTAYVIANPRSGRGSIGPDGARLTSILDEAGIDHVLELTKRRGHASDLARAALESGYRFLVAVGGDGTVHEVINGMMEDSGSGDPRPVLGVLAAGSGCDFVRTFGLPQGLSAAVRHLHGDNFFDIDLGRVSFTTEDGNIRSEYFNNIAEAGFGAEVVKRAEALPRWVGRVRYLLSFWATLASFRIDETSILLDEQTYKGPMTNLVVANGQFFGGGMNITPKAHPADGRFDVLVQSGTKRNYVAGITKVYKGEHLGMEGIKEYYAKRVEVNSERPLRIEADGEVLGFTPAVYEIVDKALRLKI